MSNRYRYTGDSPVDLRDLGLQLEPGQEFDAPDDWRPEPFPHPVLELVSKPVIQPVEPAAQEA